MATLGDLERAVMDLIWDADGPVTGAQLRDGLVAGDATGRTPAITTVLTVLSRLEAKGFVARVPDERPHRYRAVQSRAEHTALLMHDVLGSSSDRSAALARFVGRVSASDADILRELLAARASD